MPYAGYLTNLAHRETLRRVHELRQRAHWGKRHDASRDPWPKDEAEWRQWDGDKGELADAAPHH